MRSCIYNQTYHYRAIASVNHPLCPPPNHSTHSPTGLGCYRTSLFVYNRRQYHTLKSLVSMASVQAGTITMDNYQFPTHRLKAKMEDSSRTPLVLIACGSFSPITFLHLRMFEMANGMHSLVAHVVVHHPVLIFPLRLRTLQHRL